ncbi:MAG: hypothetical protein R2762_04870 [Bryobacteraceae bacterium]
MLDKAGYKTVGSCGLAEWKEKGYELIYPEAGEKEKEEEKPKN